MSAADERYVDITAALLLALTTEGAVLTHPDGTRHRCVRGVPVSAKVDYLDFAVNYKTVRVYYEGAPAGSEPAMWTTERDAA